jgi:hypothetical protein
MSIPVIIENKCNDLSYKRSKLQPSTGDEEPISIDTLSDEEIPKEEKGYITKDNLDEVIECLRAVLEISTEESESISQVITKAETT